MVDRVPGEDLRVEAYPLIRFQTGASGTRRPMLVGTRLSVHDVIATLRANDNSVVATAEYLAIPGEYVRHAVAYHADFRDEIDAAAAAAARTADAERAHWERQQRALA